MSASRIRQDVKSTILSQAISGDVDSSASDLREEIKELKRKLACKTASEYYWKKQAKSAREVIE